MAETFRDKIKAYADKFWVVPCADGIVWVKSQAINLKTEIAKQNKATKGEWSAVFLMYDDVKDGKAEGLYLIPTKDVDKAKKGNLKASDSDYPDRKLIASWHDNPADDAANAEVKEQAPTYHGLNDCTHFVTQSLA
jgi:hypothetical protein